MKTLALKTQLTKAVLLGALTIAPALALTTTAQAAPNDREVASTQSGAPLWNNGHNDRNNGNNDRDNAQRFDNHRNAPQSHSDYEAPRYQSPRFDTHRNDGRFNSRRDDHRSSGKSDTGKIIGAGIVGAILGAVLSH